MDKYEYNLKLDQMKAFALEGNYKDAAEIADTINWNKVRNVNALVKAGEIYENVGRYEDSRDILLDAYDYSPIGRTIIYRLAEVAIKMEDFEAAQEYYDEFVDIAPHDNQRYILKYNIRKAQGASYQELIPILEEFKEQEYTEEWAFELAYLYHKVGMIDKCIDACDELILWFGDGPYVERSLELKMLYQPLTKIQEDKYKQFRHEKEGKTVISAEEMQRAGEYVHDTVAIPPIMMSSTLYNTTNLQEEIVKGMQQILDATEKETVVGTMDNIKKIAEEIPYLQLPTEEELAEKEAELNIQTDEEIDDSLKINFQELLEEESDGQISLVMNEKAQLERQITGQMTISDVLEEWEKTRRAAEAALQEAEQKKLESAKARALQEAEDIMVRLNDVIPKMEELEQTTKRMPDLHFPVEEILTEEILIEKVPEEEIPPILTEEPIPVDDIPEVSVLFEIEESDDLLEDDEIEETEPAVPQKISCLTDEQKAIFSYFVPVKGMETQLCEALSGIVANLSGEPNSSTGNLIIQGSQGCGKTVLATSIIKVLQAECGRPNGKVGKIDAEVLNKKDIQQLLKKVAGGCLIIERAGELDRTSAVTLSLLLEQDKSGLLVILEDSAAGVKKALATDDGFAKKFTESVTVPIFTNDDLVGFAQSYANELGYVIDEMAILALYNRISNIEKIDQATTLEEIKDIIDGAIECEANGGIRKALNILTAKRYTDDDKIVLTEKDFQ